MPFFPWLPLIIFGGLWSIAVDSKSKELSPARPQVAPRRTRTAPTVET
jgi:hypothetical protein